MNLSNLLKEGLPKFRPSDRQAPRTVSYNGSSLGSLLFSAKKALFLLPLYYLFVLTLRPKSVSDATPLFIMSMIAVFFQLPTPLGSGVVIAKVPKIFYSTKFFRSFFGEKISLISPEKILSPFYPSKILSSTIRVKFSLRNRPDKKRRIHNSLSNSELFYALFICSFQ